MELVYSNRTEVSSARNCHMRAKNPQYQTKKDNYKTTIHWSRTLVTCKDEYSTRKGIRLFFWERTVATKYMR
jgi:hypothetical protein